MDLVLRRKTTIPEGVFGQISDAERGDPLWTSLERLFQLPDPDGGWEPKIPPGVYNCIRAFMPSLNLETFELQNVPGHTGIFIHPANWPHDLEGCIGIGEGVAAGPRGPQLMSSRAAHADFMSHQVGLDSFTLTVSQE